MDSQQATVTALIEPHGRTFAAEFGIDPARSTPSPLVRCDRARDHAVLLADGVNAPVS